MNLLESCSISVKSWLLITRKTKKGFRYREFPFFFFAFESYIRSSLCYKPTKYGNSLRVSLLVFLELNSGVLKISECSRLIYRN